MPYFSRQSQVSALKTKCQMPLLRLAALVLVVWGVPLGYPPLPAVAQSALPQSEPRARTLTVMGTGQERIPTTITQVRLGVEAQGKTAEEAQQEVARRSSTLLALLRSRNVERLETTGVSLSPNYIQVDNRQKLNGYTGRNTVSFRILTERIGNLLDAAVQAGATNIGSVSFIASDEAIAVARQAALRRATLDAQAQAKAVLAALNLQQQEVISIAINNASDPNPQQVSPGLSRPFAGTDILRTSLEVIGGEQQVQATVTLKISY
jgi:uncharacterized protein